MSPPAPGAAGRARVLAPKRRPRLYYSVAKRLTALRKTPFVAERLGARWRLFPRDWIDNRLITGRYFEIEQLNYALSLISDYDIDLFVDCGANIGLYSVLLGVHAPGLQTIEAFEPAPATRARLADNLRLNALTARARIHPCALSDAPGRAALNIMPNSSGVATLERAMTTNKRRRFTHTVEVETAPLDARLDHAGRRAFVKIDVEGHALPALRGMARFLAENEVIVQIEGCDQDAEINRLLADIGYHHITDVSPDYYFANFNVASRNIASE